MHWFVVRHGHGVFFSITCLIGFVYVFCIHSFWVAWFVDLLIYDDLCGSFHHLHNFFMYVSELQFIDTVDRQKSCTTKDDDYPIIY